MNADQVQSMLSFLTRRDASMLAQTNKFFREQVVKNNCRVISHKVCRGEAEPGKKWADYYESYKGRQERMEYVTTKENAVVLFNNYRADPQFFYVGIYHFHAELGWIANRPLWTMEWKRE